jgi:hypothetical protein
MPLGTTNIGLNDIFNELNFNPGSDLSTRLVQSISWADGPPPGANNYSYPGFGFNTGQNDQLYNPVNEAGTASVTGNYRFRYAKNLQAYMDQGTNYSVTIDLRNNLGGMMDDANFDAQLWDELYTYGPIAGGAVGPIPAGMTAQAVIDSPGTYNVYNGYFIMNFSVNDPMTIYTIDIDINGQTFNAGGLAGGASIQIDSTNLSGLPTNSGSGFLINVTFS